MDDLLSSTESGDNNAHATDGGDEFFDTYFDSADDEGDYQVPRHYLIGTVIPSLFTASTRQGRY
eukprot:scaffold8999_cov123-Skeletonema_marinoi.AAC.1